MGPEAYAAVRLLLDVAIAANTMWINYSELRGELEPVRARVIELHRASKTRALTADEQAELQSVRDQLIKLRRDAVEAYFD